MTSFTNIAAYKFAALDDLKRWREQLSVFCREQHLRGTILLSTEGINLFVAGDDSAIKQLLDLLAEIPQLGPLEVKTSYSTRQPFRRMLVKIKKEIIAFGVPEIDPVHSPAPRISPAELKAWLDAGRPVTLLDTRNNYEVKLGTFRNAVAIDIDHFRDFPAAADRLPSEWKEQPVVTFCTGGIRCEKAGPYLMRQGFRNIFQLDGGILKYFEQCGHAHYDGECFVFDQRVGLDPSLSETDASYCFACLAPVTAADQHDPRYVAGRSCPQCYRTPAEERARLLESRHEMIRQAITPLPGSQPYINERPLRVPARCAGFSLLDFLCDILPHVQRAAWQEIVCDSRMLHSNRVPARAAEIVQPGQQYLHVIPGTIEPDVNGNIRILHEDEALIVVDKPAPLPVHASGRYHRNTLVHILQQVYRPQIPRPVHRLDANTTGVMVLARTRHFASLLQPQFARGEIGKSYLALVNGSPPDDHFHCRASISPSAGQTGTRTIDHTGLEAHTEFRVLRRNPNGTTLLAAIPHTGRTNQIRIHLWSLGWPVVGEQVYLAGQTFGDTQTHSITSAPLCLHSREITLHHPLTRESITWQSERPSWAE